MRVLTGRSIGGLPHGLAKLLDGDGSFGRQHFEIEFGMVHAHLGDVCPESLGVRILEVGLNVVEGGLECSELSDGVRTYQRDFRNSRVARSVTL